MVCAPMAPPEGRPGKVSSAERSWPPRCGRSPAAPDDGDSGKGVADGKAEEAAAAERAGVSSAACNGGLPHEHDPHQPRPERDEGGGAQPPGDGDARPSDGQTESRALDVVPLALAAPQSSAVDSANGSVEDGDSLIVEGEAGHGRDQLARDDDDDTDNSGALEREEDASRKKRWLTSAVNPPPKRRAVSARRRFPPGCGSAAVTGVGIGIGGLGPSPMFGRKDSNDEIGGKREEVGGAMEVLNCKIQECQVVDRVVQDDFAGGQHDRDRPQINLTNDSPRHGFSEKKMDARTPLGVPLVAGDGDVSSESEGSLPEGTSSTLLRGHVIVKTSGKRKLKHDNMDKDSKIHECQVVDRVVLDDFTGGQHDRDRRRNSVTNDSPRHGFSEKMDARTPLGVPLVVGDGDVRSGCEGSLPEGTPRTVVRGHVNVKTYGWRKLKHDNIDKDSQNKSGKVSKCGHHVAAAQIEEKDDVGRTTKRVIIQALMAPDQCPWIQRKKSIASVSKSLTPRNKVKKKDATPRQEFPSEVTPSTSTRYKTREDQKDFSPDVHERSNEFCVTLPSCGDESVGTQSKVTKMDETCPLDQLEHAPLVTVDVKYEGSLQKGNPLTPKMGETGPLDQLEHAPLVTVDVKYEGSSQKGNPMTHVRGLVNVKTKGKNQEIVKVNVAWVDETGVFEEGTAADNISSTHRRVTRSNMKVKQCMVAPKLKHDGIDKDPLDRSTKESKCGKHLSTDQTKENDGKGLVSNSVVLALMAPDISESWTQGKRSIASASEPLSRGNKYLTVREGLSLPDISEGKESIPICVFNTIDDMQPMPFKYITKVMYPPSYEKASPKGCDCTDGCSDSSECACAVKNEGEIPFNLNSAIVYTKPVIYECGPSCRCPPTCHNRVSQHGPKIQLEIFKTGKTGWGVRSPSYISSGSFICEYVGEVLQETDAERTENDEYLFDIGRDDSDDDEEGSQSSTSEMMNKDLGYTIDAAKCGNVGRFINHSCFPNLHAQDVLWDHDDRRVPHVMLFAEKNIRPLQELTYDYNYKIGQVRQNGKEKIKDCFCGSSKCRLRLY